MNPSNAGVRTLRVEVFMRQRIGQLMALGLMAVLFMGMPSLAAEDPIPGLERERDASPRRAAARHDLAEAYYLRARAALDDQRYPEYEQDLGRALDEWIVALRLEPESPRPHTWMGIVAIYQGDIDRALRSFANARRLAPRDWVNYTNIAETMIYRGRLDSAEKFLRRGEDLRADPAIVELNMSLLNWRAGRLDDAQYHFEEAYHLDPEVVKTWNEAPISSPLRTFDDLTRYCCGSPSCGPYMGEACEASELEVAERIVPAEVARQELVLEMERRRKLREIYGKRRDLGVEIEEDPREKERAVEIEVERDQDQE